MPSLLSRLLSLYDRIALSDEAQDKESAMYSQLPYIHRQVKSFRCSSWDRTGGNFDYLVLQPGQTVALLEEEGPGRITHFYWTTINASRFHFRQLVLRAWWDNEEKPSVEVPIGDLFCVPHCMPQPIRSLMAVVNTGHCEVNTWGFNLYFPMPFRTRARVELTYDALPGLSEEPINFWYHADMERYEGALPAEVGYFHAQWRRENPTTPKAGTAPNVTDWRGLNIGGEENYVALVAKGCGQMVGLHLQVDNLGGGWYGEGDDMVFVDGRPGEEWPPTYHGTGTEEIFGGGACPNVPYSGPYTGFHMVEHPDFSGKSAMYRWYLADPIRFRRSLVWTIEHGHDNNYQNDYTSVAYWYQTEPHAPLPPLLPVEKRLPRLADDIMDAERERSTVEKMFSTMRAEQAEQVWLDRMWGALNPGCFALLRGDAQTAMARFAEARKVYQDYLSHHQ
jgi:hypothetical protein